MMTAILILHGILAAGLLGAITHQAFAVSLKSQQKAGASFFVRLRATDAGVYRTPVLILFLAVAVIGGVLYPSYRQIVRPLLQAQDLRAANGAFELKEHFSAIGALLLPAYWLAWKPPLAPEFQITRMWLTWILAVMVWWNFIVGQLLVAIRGLFA
jgi:hypothetical protein